MENLINRVRLARSMGATRDEVVEHFHAEFSIEDIYLAWVASTILDDAWVAACVDEAEGRFAHPYPLGEVA